VSRGKRGGSSTVVNVSFLDQTLTIGIAFITNFVLEQYTFYIGAVHILYWSSTHSILEHPVLNFGVELILER
jgi:hypothetical protein